MIDWFSGLVGYNAQRLQPNTIAELTPDGEILWRSERKIRAVGSYDASIQLGRTSPTDEMISASSRYGLLCNPREVMQISGNPSKFLQGHNVFGPSVSSLGPVVTATVRGLPGELRPDDADSDLPPAVHRSRVDITTSVHLGNHQTVHDWLLTAEYGTRSRHGRPLISGDTVYWGKNSRRWTMKAYCKHCELKQHPVRGDRKLTERLMDYCEGHLRIELTLRQLELKNRGTLYEDLIWEYFKKISVGVAVMDKDNVPTDMPDIVKYTFVKWMSGVDVRLQLPKTTFYRHRKLILDKTGFDISLNASTMPHLKEKTKIDVEYLMMNEIKDVPAIFQGLLFKPEETREYPAH